MRYFFKRRGFVGCSHDQRILGAVWGGGAERSYLNTYPGMADQTDCKTVQQWPLLGDPILKIGGYE